MVLCASAHPTLQQSHTSEFTCLICHTLIDLSSTLTKPCEHAFCTSCLDPWLKLHKRCPTCNEDLSHSTSTEALKGLAHRVLRRIKVRCPCREFDCDWTGDYADLQSHMAKGDHFIDMFGEEKRANPKENLNGPQRTSPKQPPPARGSSESPLPGVPGPSPRPGHRVGVARAYKDQADSRFRSAAYADALDLYLGCVSVLSGSLPPGPGEDEAATLLASCRANAAACEYMLGDYEACVKSCDECISLDPGHAKAAVRRSRALLAAGEFDEAVGRMEGFLVGCKGEAREKASRELPSLLAARDLWTLGVGHLGSGRHDLAKASFNSLLKSTSAPRVVLGCAKCDLGLGLVDSATRLCRNLNR